MDDDSGSDGVFTIQTIRFEGHKLRQGSHAQQALFLPLVKRKCIDIH